MNSDRIAEILTELGLEFKREQPEPDVAGFVITLDPDTPPITALHYGVEDDGGEFLRLMGFVDVLDPDEPLLQLRLVMELNVELPMGAYCLEPEDNYIFATVNLPADDLQKEDIEDAIELLYLAQDVYDGELGLEADEEIAQG